MRLDIEKYSLTLSPNWGRLQKLSLDASSENQTSLALLLTGKNQVFIQEKT